ncbi:MAG TPA: formate/nitrite transporter family protein [Acidimicrobiia bacterium]|nr:formate/nitrite transporter family protein [Acidimicrobiia bacterium]
MENRDIPRATYIPAEGVISEMASWGRRRIDELGWPKILILGMMGGAFITAGALFSLLLGSGVESPGVRLFVEGFGFSAGFFFVVLSEAALFTEANVVMPAALLSRESETVKVFRFWGLALAGNVIGAVLLGVVVAKVGHYSAEYTGLLEEIVEFKLSFQDGGVGGWFEALLSGVAANWLVGMAAFFGTMGRTIFGKYIPVLLAVSTFIAAGFQHSPANFGYFSLAWFGGTQLSVWDVVVWNLIPAGLGNVIGGTFLVALPFWYIWGRRDTYG